MLLFEWVVLLLSGALLLAGLARRAGAPYPTFLALGGTVLAFVPGTPVVLLEPDLALALFLAPVLMDAAYGASLRDLKANGLPIAGLVLGAVGLTTVAVAVVAKALLPDLPWAAAIALGAIVAPPDAAAATSVLRQVGLPHRLLVILEGESLLNDASSLLVYRLAVAATLAGAFSPEEVAPAFLLGVAGSLVAGPLLGWLFLKISRPIEDTSTVIVLQFVGAFGVWLLAERLELSAVLTIVTYGLTIARHAPLHTPAHQRQPAHAVWETAVFVLNVLAFVLIGLQVGPIVERLEPGERLSYGLVALAVLATTMLVRFAWVMGSGLVVVAWRRWRHGIDREADAAFLKSGLAISWSGMRGVVSLAAALALPADGPAGDGFPHRDLAVLTAFCVVLGTLVLQGLTLRPLLARLGLRDDDPVGREIGRARARVLQAASASIAHERSEAATALRQEYDALLRQAEQEPKGEVAGGVPHDHLRRRAVDAARETLLGLRDSGEIGDDAFHALEEELDRIELSVAR